MKVKTLVFVVLLMLAAGLQVPSDATAAFSIDPVKSPTNNPQQTVTGSRESGAIITVTCPTAAVSGVRYPTDTTWRVIVSNLSEGENVVSAADTSTTVTAVIVFDSVPPDTIITSAPAVLTNSKTASLGFASSEAGSTFECSLDNAAFTACTTPAGYTGLGEGSHSFQVRAIDQVGNTDATPAIAVWTIDTVPPVAAITGAPTGLTKSRNASLTVSGNDVVAYKYHLGSGVFSVETIVSAPILLSGLLDGDVNVFVIGKDSAGNWQPEGSPTTAGWTVDITPPALVLSTLSDGKYTNNPVLNVAGTASDANGIQSLIVSGQTVTLSTTDNKTYTFSYPVSLTTGTNTITTIATDMAGNSTTDSRNIILDQTAPVVTITNPADNSVTNSAAVSVTGSVDKVSTIRVKVNNGSPLPEIVSSMLFTFPITLATGSNNIEVTAIDPANNQGSTKRSVTLDNVNPALAITVPSQDMGTNQAAVSISGTVSDLTSVSLVVTCPTASVGMVGMPTTTAWTVDVTNMQQGINTVTVTATDQAGNSSTVVRNIISTQTPITIDPVKTPTNVSQQQISGVMELNSLVTVSFTTGVVSAVSYPTPTTWTAIVADMSEGANTVSAIATDLEGRTSNPISAVIVLDTHAPVTTPSPASGTYYNQMTVTLAANEAATIYFTTDGTAPTTASPVYSGPVLLTATTTVKFFAVDTATNAEQVKSVAYTLISDITPPVTTITAGAPKYTSGTGQLYGTGATQFTLSASDGGSGVKTTTYRVDNGSWNTYASGFSLLAEGNHTIGYRSIDNAGNSEQEKTLNAVVDNSPPVSSITVGTPPVTVSSLISISAVDSGSGVQKTEYAVDGSSWTAYKSGFTLAAYSQGTHTVSYRSTDNVGNVEATKTKAVQLWIDRPSITTTALADGTVGAAYSQTLTATGATAPYLWSIATGTLPAGLQLNQTTGTISGQPLSAATATVTFQAADANNMTGTKALSLTIFGPVGITTASLASGVTGSAYSQTLAATGGKTPYAWSISTGSLPSGLSLNGSTGVISGSPTAAGTSTFTVQVKEANNAAASKAFTVTINKGQALGVFAAWGMTMSGALIDSYDSTKGSYSGTHGANATVGTNATFPGAVILSGLQTTIYGNVLVGPGGNPAWVVMVSPGASITGSKSTLTAARDMTPRTLPTGGTPVSFTNGTTLTSGTYRTDSLNLYGTQSVTISGNVTLYVTGSINLTGSSRIVIPSGSSVTVYLNGGLNMTDASVINQANPGALTVYGTASCFGANFTSTSKFSGVLNVPAATVSLAGGTINGAVIARWINLSGGAAVHYDESLGTVGQ